MLLNTRARASHLNACAQHRRAFLGNSAQGLGTLALAWLLQSQGLVQSLSAATRGVLRPLPLPQKARRVIWLTMAGWGSVTAAASSIARRAR